MSGDILLRTEKICKEFNHVPVLNDVDFDLRAGEIHSLIGENGAGKSTFIKIISGVYEATSGKYFINGEEKAFRTAKESEDAGLYTIHQEINLVPYFNAFENIFIGNEQIKKNGLLDDKAMAQKAREVLAELNIDLDVTEPVSHFNTSLQRIIQISSALIYKPDILIFDEPTTALGEEEREKLLEIICRLRDSGIGIIYISHNIEEIVQISDRATVFKDGYKVGTLDREEMDSRKIVSMMIGNQAYEVFNRQHSAEGAEEMLRVENLRSSKLKDVSFSLKRGEILGVAGVIGAGKSEVARAIFGIDRLASGEVYIKGEKYHPKSTTAVAHGLAFVPEERRGQGLVSTLKVSENVSMAYLDDFTNHYFLQRKKEYSKTMDFIKELSIKTQGPDQIINYLSGGNQQKVVLSKWLTGDFEILILDEPTKGIDVMAKRDIYKLVNDLAEQGKAVLFLSSYLPELLNFCDRIMVLNDGAVVGEFPSTGAEAEINITHAMLGGKVR